MKALTLWQPWASLIVDLRKPVETRSWGTSYRGPLAIHAGMKVDADACSRFGYVPSMVPRGAVLGTSVLSNCVVFPDDSVTPDDYGDYTPGRFGFVLTEVVKFARPVQAKGMYGLWEWPGNTAPIKNGRPSKKTDLTRFTKPER